MHKRGSVDVVPLPSLFPPLCRKMPAIADALTFVLRGCMLSYSAMSILANRYTPLI